MADDPLPFASLGPIGINAWTGTTSPRSPFVDARDGWAVATSPLRAQQSAAPHPPGPEAWQDPRIGWGLVLPYRPGLTPEQLGTADDAPEPIRALLAARPASRVLRYRPGTANSDWVLHDYLGAASPMIATAPEGIAPGCIPGYLLIAASPAEVPWLLQYELNVVRRVGRLDLPPEGLANYVQALLSGWSDCQTRYDSPLVWATDHGGGDITSLMRDVVAEPIYAAYRADQDGDMSNAVFLDGRGGDATGAALAAALAAQRPSVVVTSSHGQTGPADRPEEMLALLGALVDADHQAVSPATLLAGWQPAGAVWFAQACCSAGSESPSLYRGLFDEAAAVGRVLEQVAALGARVAPLPQALLGAPAPLRAFIGHVEPTFDWTLVYPPTRQWLSSSLVELMYTGVCSGRPVGLALDEARLYDAVGSLLIGHLREVSRYASASGRPARRTALDKALYSKVTAFDRASTVLLGDPTVAIPLPP